MEFDISEVEENEPNIDLILTTLYEICRKWPKELLEELYKKAA